ncbi:MAG: MATE family efflux transporter [Desulfovibrionaceae bacterium]|nr:MATE family efflux transporter [Desulfovibrionaceae bacterium]
MVMMYSVVLTGLTAVWTAGQINADTQGALGMVNQCSFFLMVVIMAISSGATAAVSQSLGANKLDRAKHYIQITIFGSLALGVIFALFGYSHGTPVLRLLQVPEEIIPLASSMWDWMMLGLPAQHVYAATGVIFRATRQVIPPLWIALFINVLNPLLCLGLGLGFFGLPKMGYVGLLLANIIAQTVGAILNCLLLVKSQYLDRLSLPSWQWLKTGLPYLLKVALPAGLASFFWQTGYLMLFVLVASVPNNGVAALAGLTAGLRIESLLFLPGMAVNSSIAVLVGNCLGAGDKDKAKRLALNITLLTTIALSFVALIIWPFRANIAQAFAQDLSTQEHIISYLTYNLISTPFSIASTVMGGVMVGAGATQYNLAVYGGCSWLIRLPLGFILGHKILGTAEGIFCAMLISQTVQASIMILVIKYCNWTKFTLHKPKVDKT